MDDAYTNEQSDPRDLELNRLRKRIADLEQVVAGADYLESLCHRDDMVQAAKMIALGTLVSGMAHEINNPTNFITINAPILKDIFKDIEPVLDDYARTYDDFELCGIPYAELRDEIPTLFRGIEEGAKRIRNIVRDLRDYARPDSTTFAQVQLNDVVRASVNLMSNTLAKKTDRLSIRYGEDVPMIKGNAQKLEQVMVNLLLNACQALPSKQAAIEIHTHQAEQSEVIVVIADEGCGITAENISRIQDPFFTTRRDEGAIGLGLSLCSRVLAQHHAHMVFESRENQGTRVSLHFPVL